MATHYPNEKIELDPDASLLDSVPMTVLLHKPAGFDWSSESSMVRWSACRVPLTAFLTAAFPVQCPAHGAM
jgi:hypothetical protein